MHLVNDNTHFLIFFHFNAPATTEIYTLSLHDALPISDRCTKPHIILLDTLLINIPNNCQTNISWRSGFPDRKSTRLNSSHVSISYAVFCLKKKKNNKKITKTYQINHHTTQYKLTRYTT